MQRPRSCMRLELEDSQVPCEKRPTALSKQPELQSGNGSLCCLLHKSISRLASGSILGRLLILLAFTAFLLFVVSWRSLSSKAPPVKQYEVLIDAGSTGTRIHVFTWETRARLIHFSLPEPVLRSATPLSSLHDAPRAIEGLLQPLLDFAYIQVPKDMWHRTPVRLLATAGMRLLPIDDANSVLKNCQSVLRKSSFLFQNSFVKLISGELEGKYAWVAANYATGMLKVLKIASEGDNEDEDDADNKYIEELFLDKSLGVLDMGGASVQITYLSTAGESASRNLSEITLSGYTYELMTMTYLGLGLETSEASFVRMLNQKNGSNIENPCRSGVSGSLDFGKCLILVSQWSKNIVCPDSSCAEARISNTDLQGNFLAVENFYWTAKALGLSSRATLRQVLRAAEHHCSDRRSAILAEKYCFAAAHIITLLRDLLGFSLDQDNLEFTNTVITSQGQETQLDWALGAVIMTAIAN